MEFSRQDRLILANQYRILAQLYPEYGYDEYVKILEWGFEDQYDHLLDSIYDPPMSVGECQEVADIMEMYQALKICYDGLGDKTGIEPHEVDFHGFDGNNELYQVAYANFLQGQHRFTDIGHGNLNQGVRSLGIYRRMLAEWGKIADYDKFRLTKEDMRRILDARRVTE